MGRGKFDGRSIGTLCAELCKTAEPIDWIVGSDVFKESCAGWVCRSPHWKGKRPIVDLAGLKEAQVQSHSPSGTNVPSDERTLAPANKTEPFLCAAAMPPYVKIIVP